MKSNRFDDASTLFGRLRDQCADVWREYCEHEFVQRIGNASLPERCFRHYLQQDYLFLIHFARAWALAIYKADGLRDMRAGLGPLEGILNREMELHVEFCRGWGVSRETMERTPEARANMAYTRYVLERGLAGDVLDLHVALAPCVVGYAEIGHRLACCPSVPLADNPYRAWIEMYAGDDFQDGAAAAIRQLDRLADERSADDRMPSLLKTFRQATALEVGFWDMGLGLGT